MVSHPSPVQNWLGWMFCGIGKHYILTWALFSPIVLSSSCSSPCRACRALLPSCNLIPAQAHNIWANFSCPWSSSGGYPCGNPRGVDRRVRGASVGGTSAMTGFTRGCTSWTHRRRTWGSTERSQVGAVVCHPAAAHSHSRPHWSLLGWVIMSPAAGSGWLLSPAARDWGHSASKSL